MRQIIAGKTYDTTTAVRLESYESPLNRRDFGWFRESLYRTRNGRYFLAGHGNAASPYRQSAGLNCWYGGDRIDALTPAEALAWMERNRCEPDDRAPDLLAMVEDA